MAVILSPSSLVSALEAGTPPADYYSPVFITAFQTSVTTPPTTAVDAVELYNGTDEPVNVRGWTIKAFAGDESVCSINVASDDVYIPPEGYVVLAAAGLFGNANVREFPAPCGRQDSVINRLELTSPARLEETIRDLPTGGFVRKGLTTTYRDEDDDFLDNFSPITSRPNATLYVGEWYQPAAATAMQISEILPRARSCSPLATAPDCHDYVKLYNPTAGPINLTGLRLRIGYQGQNVTTSNAIVLAGTLGAGRYGIIDTKADGAPLAVTDGGGWVWFEDTYGIKRYDGTVVSYPSASSITKIGWAWAYNETSGNWQWTSTPTPYDRPSVFTQPAQDSSAGTSSSTLVPCRADQYRNPATNRCKLRAAAASGLQPCAANQFRNPATNRCKSLASTASTLKPCAANQERNPATNRCRTKAVLAAADFPVKNVPEGKQAAVGWWAFGGAAVLAAGYAGWEWRREVLRGVLKVASLFGAGK
jgi:hypothetical protein